MTSLPPRPDWMTQALCAGTSPAFFYSDHGRGFSTTAAVQQARAVCAECPVKTECLEWAVENYELGVWGGTTEKERETMRGDFRASLGLARGGPLPKAG